jgi:AcrR family transcriptional regulator
MSIYHYMKNKDDLLAALVDRLYGEIELPTDVPEADWEQAFRRALQSFYDVLLRHPAALELFTTQPSTGPNGMAVLGWAYDRCRRAGLGPEEAAQTFHFCVAFVIGHAATELGMMAQLEGGRELAPDNDAVAPDFAQFLERNVDKNNQQVFEVGLEMLFTSLANTFGLVRH